MSKTRVQLWRELKQLVQESGYPNDLSYNKSTKILIQNEIDRINNILKAKTLEKRYTTIYRASIEADILGQRNGRTYVQKKLVIEVLTKFNKKDRDLLLKLYKKADELLYKSSIKSGHYSDLTTDIAIDGREINSDDIVMTPVKIKHNELAKYELESYKAVEYFGMSKGYQINKNQCVLNMIYLHLQSCKNIAKVTLGELRNSLGNTPNIIEVGNYLTSKKIPHSFRDVMGNILCRMPSIDGSNCKALYGCVSNGHIYTTNSDSSTIGVSVKPDYKKMKIIESTIPYCDEDEEYRFRVSCFEYDALREVAKSNETVIYETENPLEGIAKVIYDKEQLLVENIIYNHNMTQFTYRTVFVVKKQSYDVRAVINAIQKSDPLNLIYYKNQGYGSLAQDALGSRFTQKSIMNANVLESFIELTPDHQIKTLLEASKYPQAVTYDINGSYTNALYNRNEPWFLLSVVDEWVKTDKYMGDGYYMITGDLKLGVFNMGKQMIIRSGQLNYLTNNDVDYKIIAYLRPSYKVSCDKIREIVDYVYSLDIEKKHKKLLINAFIGMLGRHERVERRNMLTTDNDMNFAMYCDGTIDDITTIGRMYMVSKSDSERIYKNNRPMWHDIINDGVFQLYEMYKKMVNDKSILIGYKLDSITMVNANQLTTDNELGGYKREQTKDRPISDNYVNKKEYQMKYSEWKDVSKYVDGDIMDSNYVSEMINDGKSFLVQGEAGFGKSYLVSTLCKDRPHIATGISHQLRIQLREMGLKSCVLASLFRKHQEQSDTKYWSSLINKCKEKIIIVDEYTMLSREYLEKLYMLKLKTNCQMIFIGDCSQLSSVDCKINNYDMDIVKFMCDNQMIEMKYNYRADKKLLKIARAIRNGDSIDCPFKKTVRYDDIEKAFNDGKVIPMNRVNICFTKETRNIINKMCCRWFSPGVCDKLGLYYGCPIIYKCVRGHGCYNGDKLIYSHIDGENVVLIDCDGENIVIPVCEFRAATRLGYCFTIHSSQGLTIKEDMSIFEVSKFSKRMAYTAITRAKRFEQISVDNWRNIFWNDKQPVIEDITKEIGDHCVYQLVADGKVFYIGQTNDIVQRKKQHLSCNIDRKLYNYMKTIGDWELIPLYYCSKNEVDELEKSVIDRCVEMGYELQNTYLVSAKSVGDCKALAECVDKELKFKLVGHIKNNKSSWVFIVQKGDKKIEKRYRYGKKRTEDEAKELAHKQQEYYSIHGEFF